MSEPSGWLGSKIGAVLTTNGPLAGQEMRCISITVSKNWLMMEPIIWRLVILVFLPNTRCQLLTDLNSNFSIVSGLGIAFFSTTKILVKTVHGTNK